MHPLPRTRLLLLTAACAAASPAFTHAQTAWSNPATGDWSDAANWLAGEPAADTLAEVSNGGTAQVTATGEEAGLLTIGSTEGATPASASGRVEVLGGSLTINGSGAQGLFVGDSEGATGSLLLGSGSVVVDGGGADLVVGRSGTGTLAINGGTLGVSDNWIIGNTPTGVGSATQTAGDVTLGGSVFLGGQGVGSLEMSGGTLSLPGGGEDFRVGQTGTGTFTLSGNAEVVVQDNILIAANGSATGTVDQSGGSFTANGSYFVGAQGTGTHNLSGGTLTANTNVYVGRNGRNGQPADGTFNQTGGTVLSSNAADPALGGFYLADFEGSTAEYNLSGGTLTVDGRFTLAASQDSTGEATSTNTGSFNVIGAGGSATFGEFLFADTDRATFGFDVASDGVSLLSVAADAFIGGSNVDMGTVGGFVPTLGQSYELITAASIDALPSLAAADAASWELSLASGGNGQTLVATFVAIPEPGTAVLGVAGLALLAGRRRSASAR